MPGLPDAQALQVELFSAGKAAQLAVPPLPKVTRVQAPREPLPRPGVRTLAPAVAAPKARGLEVDRGLETKSRSEVARVLTRPFVFAGEDLGKLPKNLWMRYSLALVKATGENVRNLEVVGLYRERAEPGGSAPRPTACPRSGRPRGRPPAPQGGGRPAARWAGAGLGAAQPRGPGGETCTVHARPPAGRSGLRERVCR